MTRATNARVAGFTFLFYIAAGLTGIFVGSGVGGGDGTAAKLASYARHVPQVRAEIVLGLVIWFTALTLGVALYGLTREEDRELAVLALFCRVYEAFVGVVPILATLGLLSFATAGTGAADVAGVNAVAAYLMKVKGWTPILSGFFFAVGSMVFSYLMLRGRMIPIGLAWLGVLASVLLVIALPAQLAGVLHGAIAQLVWIPMAAFEIPLGFWLLIKGVATSERR